jgi:hypothetical protein
MSEGRAHLYARPLTAKRQARADRQQTAGEFDRQQNEWGGRQLAADYCLHLRNAAAHSMLTETAHKPCAEGRGRRRSHDQDDAAEKRLGVPPHGHGDADAIGLFQRQPEEPANKPRPRPGDAGEQCQRDQARTGENPLRLFNMRSYRRKTRLFRLFLGPPVLVDFMRIARVYDIRFDYDIVRTAGQDEVFDIVAPNDNKLAPPIPRRPALPVSGTRSRRRNARRKINKRKSAATRKPIAVAA